MRDNKVVDRFTGGIWKNVPMNSIRLSTILANLARNIR